MIFLFILCILLLSLMCLMLLRIITVLEGNKQEGKKPEIKFKSKKAKKLINNEIKQASELLQKINDFKVEGAD